MEGKIAVLGSTDFVMPFSALGLDTFVTEENTEAVSESTKQILAGRYTLVVVAENIAELAEDFFEATAKKTTPCVVVAPFTTEPKGFATESLGKLLKIATGIDILQND